MDTNIKFVQLADPQFGMFAHFSGISDQEILDFKARNCHVRKSPLISGCENEKRLFGKAIDASNRIQPDFVVVCGDMTNNAADPVQIGLVKSGASKLSPNIPIHWVPGNHDVAVDNKVPTQEYIDKYRQNYGNDYYAFDLKGVKFLVINSVVLDRPDNVNDELKSQLSFIDETLTDAERHSVPVIVFTHHPLFLSAPDEPVDEYPNGGSFSLRTPSAWSVHRARRDPLIDRFNDSTVIGVFAGHGHRNHYSEVGKITMVASSSVGYPLENDPSGYRIVSLDKEKKMSHKFFSL